MTQSYPQSTELTFAAGTVTYSFQTEDGSKDATGEDPTFAVPFQNLSEMLLLLTPEKVEFYRQLNKVKTMKVESVGFVARNEEENIQVETLMMDDGENFIELIQS
jgi:hypothetical protein